MATFICPFISVHEESHLQLENIKRWEVLQVTFKSMDSFEVTALLEKKMLGCVLFRHILITEINSDH